MCTVSTWKRVGKDRSTRKSRLTDALDYATAYAAIVVFVKRIRGSSLFQQRSQATYGQGWRQEFSDGGLTLPTKELKYGFESTINAKNLRKRFAFQQGASMFQQGLYPPLALS